MINEGIISPSPSPSPSHVHTGSSPSPSPYGGTSKSKVIHDDIDYSIKYSAYQLSDWETYALLKYKYFSQFLKNEHGRRVVIEHADELKLIKAKVREVESWADNTYATVGLIEANIATKKNENRILAKKLSELQSQLGDIEDHLGYTFDDCLKQAGQHNFQNSKSYNSSNTKLIGSTGVSGGGSSSSSSGGGGGGSSSSNGGVKINGGGYANGSRPLQAAGSSNNTTGLRSSSPSRDGPQPDYRFHTPLLDKTSSKGDNSGITGSNTKSHSTGNIRSNNNTGRISTLPLYSPVYTSNTGELDEDKSKSTVWKTFKTLTGYKK